MAGFVAVAVLLAACTETGSPPGAEEPRVGETPVMPSPLIDVTDIRSGGPPPDGIPPIDEPKFQSVADVDWLVPGDPVISVSVDGETRAYPLRILVWHEIVNDRIAGVPVVVTYCPLCNTGIAFRRPLTTDGELLDFGTSGKLYRSNLLMYDRQTESLWPQAQGEAVVGPLTGTKLEFLATQTVAWRDWADEHPSGLVLSRDTGVDRPYGTTPYPGYDSGQAYLFDGKADPRLPETARVLGVVEAEGLTAFPYAALEEHAVGDWSVAEAAVGGRPIAVFWVRGTHSALDDERIEDARDVGSAVAYKATRNGKVFTFSASQEGIHDTRTGSTWNIFGRATDGPLEGEMLEPALGIDSFWFDWAAFHPTTAIDDFASSTR